MAHRLNLAAGQASASVPALDVFAHMLKNLYWFYKNSPSRKAHLHWVMELVECEVYELQVRQLHTGMLYDLLLSQFDYCIQLSFLKMDAIIKSWPMEYQNIFMREIF